MNTFSWKFDVALSFAGEDRAIARAIAEALRRSHLNVFYDEWHKSEIWGRDLTTLLQEIYNTARFCIVIVSKSYLSRPYARHELSAILDRRLFEDQDFLLPVRLDQTVIPGLSRAIGYVEYSKEGPENIAALAAERIHLAQPINAIEASTSFDVASRSFLASHAREIPGEFYSVEVPEFIEAFKQAELYSAPLGRARLASELLGYLNWRHEARLGTPYGAWREGDRVYLSTLPSLQAAQRTLEFEFVEPYETLKLASVWRTNDERYGAIPYYAWQPAVKGLTADRADLDLDREVVIKILEDRGAEFGFPIVPVGTVAEKLCGWITQEPPSDYLSWSRDPRLVPGQIGNWQTGFHRPSGTGILQFSLQGRWSSSGFHALAEGLTVLLPGRYQNYTVGQGHLRITVLLCGARADGFRMDEDSGSWTAAVRRTNALIARIVAAGRGLPLPPPRDTSALPPLAEEMRGRFRWALSEQGDGEYTKLVDQADGDFDKATWIKLRHQFLGLNEPPRFSFDNIVTPSELSQFVLDNER